jgi:hypothetical protein
MIISWCVLKLNIALYGNGYMFDVSRISQQQGKSKRDTFWASIMMVSSSKQFIYLKKCTSVFMMLCILAATLYSSLLEGDR